MAQEEGFVSHTAGEFVKLRMENGRKETINQCLASGVMFLTSV